MSDAAVTERDAVKRERAAFLAGIHLREEDRPRNGFKTTYCGRPIEEEAARRYPLPKVTRYRTFTFGLYDYRVNGSVVESTDGARGWLPTHYGNGTAEQFAAEMTRLRKWDILAAFADVCANPVEEVEAP